MADDLTRDNTDSVSQFATSANKQLKAAGVDTSVMANRAGDLGQLIKDEIVARPFQALGIAAVIGFLWGVTR